MYKILTINPGSTSTKIAVFEDENVAFEATLGHSTDELNRFNKIIDQFEFRSQAIIESLEKNFIDINTLDAVVGRGGGLKPIQGGTYKITENMLEDLREAIAGEHASNLGAILANNITKELNIPSYIVDPPVVDEMEPIAKISGLCGIERESKFHALNQKAVARHAAKEIGKAYEDSNLIVVHLGGGISVGAHCKGRVIDVNNALDGDGPFTPERSGGVPVGDIIRMCFSGKYSIDEMKKKINGKGGLVSYLRTNDCREVNDMIKKGDKDAMLTYRAMAYQIAKAIGSYATVLSGQVDAIVITGGIAYDETFVSWIVERVSFISNVKIYPGEHEMLALAEGGLRVLRGEEKPKIYQRLK